MMIPFALLALQSVGVSAPASQPFAPDTGPSPRVTTLAPQAQPYGGSSSHAPVHRAAALGGGSQDVEVDLMDVGHDMEIDVARNLLYVSIPVRNEIVVIDLDSFSIVDNVFVGTRPHGIDISADGSVLYCALNQASSVAVLDLETRAVIDTINIGTLLDHPSTWDVVEGTHGKVYATANPGSGGFAYVVEIDRNNGNAAQRVASNRIIRAGPTFAKDPLGAALYVRSGFSPNSYYKLSLLQANVPIVLEDNHGSVSGTQHSDISPDGTRAYLRSGQILSTSDFSQVGLIGSGPSQVSDDNTLAYVAQQGGEVELWDTQTQLQVGSVNFPCSSTQAPQTLRLMPDDSGVLVLVGGFVCGTSDAELRSLMVTPFSTPVLSSQAFDICLIMDLGTAVPQDVTATRNGDDVTDIFDSLGVDGFTPNGEITLRVPGRYVEVPGRNVLDVDVLLSDGSRLVAQSVFDSITVSEP